MQAVILAAGKSTRTYPLTLTRPKSLLRIANETILEHNLKQLEGLADEIVIIVGYKKGMIEDFVKEKGIDKRFKIIFVEQKEQMGTGHALLQAKDCLNDRFILMYGDDLYSRKDIENCLKHKYCLLGQRVKDSGRFGVLVTEGNNVKEIVEKPKGVVSDIANCGVYVLDKKIFDFQLEKTERNEYEITDCIRELAKTDDVHYETVKDYWLPIGYPWGILNANEHFLRHIKNDVKGTLESNAIVKGNVVIGENTVIKSGSYIEGPTLIGNNCIIGPNCYITNSTIGNDCSIGTAEVNHSVIMDGVKMKHFSFAGNSIIGENVNVSAGVITADLRHDNENVKSMINGKKTDSGRRKFGSVIGDNVKLGVNTLIYPGRKIWPNKETLPGETVKKDIM